MLLHHLIAVKKLTIWVIYISSSPWVGLQPDYVNICISQGETNLMNGHVFCHLTGKSRRLGRFVVKPPEEGFFYLKVYAKPENDISSEDSDHLDHVATLLIKAINVSINTTFERIELRYRWFDSSTDWSDLLKVKGSVQPFPMANQPWGLTGAFFRAQCQVPRKLYLEPVLRMYGEQRKTLNLQTPGPRLISSCHFVDSMGNELMQEQDKDIKYTVLVKSRQIHQSSDEEVKSAGHNRYKTLKWLSITICVTLLSTEYSKN